MAPLVAVVTSQPYIYQWSYAVLVLNYWNVLIIRTAKFNPSQFIECMVLVSQSVIKQTKLTDIDVEGTATHRVLDEGMTGKPRFGSGP